MIDFHSQYVGKYTQMTPNDESVKKYYTVA